MYRFRYLHGKKACAIMNGTGIRSIAKWHLEQRGMRNGGQDHTAQRSELFLRERRGQRESEAARSGHSGMRQHRGAARHRICTYTQKIYTSAKRIKKGIVELDVWFVPGLPKEMTIWQELGIPKSLIL